MGAVVHADERQFLIDTMGADDVAGIVMQRDVYAENTDLIRQLVNARATTLYSSTRDLRTESTPTT